MLFCKQRNNPLDKFIDGVYDTIGEPKHLKGGELEESTDFLRYSHRARRGDHGSRYATAPSRHQHRRGYGNNGRNTSGHPGTRHNHHPRSHSLRRARGTAGGTTRGQTPSTARDGEKLVGCFPLGNKANTSRDSRHGGGQKRRQDVRFLARGWGPRKPEVNASPFDSMRVEREPPVWGREVFGPPFFIFHTKL